MSSNGVTISVTAETNAGGRKHMEDYIAVNLSPNDSLKAIPEMKEQAYVGVFDGHGGKEAAKFARENLWELIQRHPKFQTQDVYCVREAIAEAYVQLHEIMLESRDSWIPNKTGDLSTAGTTASTVIFRKNHIFVANVGDSTGVMGIRNPRYGEPGEPPLIPKLITKDHKPEDPEEQENIRRLGGEVALSMKGVMRVVWKRERTKSNGLKEIDMIPFLSVARSLGDYWSYNPHTQEYTVSPVPHIYDFPLDLSEQKFIVVASDGLWNVMTPSDVVNFVYEYDNNDKTKGNRDVVSALIQEALNRWERRKLQADNIAVLVAYLTEEIPSSETSNQTTGKKQDALSDGQTYPFLATSNDICSTSNNTTELETDKSQLPDMKIKLKHKKKHKRHKKHGLERELARRGLHKHRLTHHQTTLESVMVSSSTSLQMETDLSSTPPMLDTFQDDSLLISSDSVQCGLKRKHTPTLEEDEGVSLLIPDEKKTRPDDLSCIATDALLALRSQRISTDAGSDSGSSTSSGVVSDILEPLDRTEESSSKPTESDQDLTLHQMM